MELPPSRQKSPLIEALKFTPPSLRDDAGMLWENYIILERLKKQEYLGPRANNYFWRTNTRHEIYLVE